MNRERLIIFRTTIAIVLVILLSIAAFLYLKDNISSGERSSSSNNPKLDMNNDTYPASSLKLTSPAFEDGFMLPVEYTCNGSDIQPGFFISGVPKGSASLAFTLEDPDTSIGTFDHWVKFDMDPAPKEIKKGIEPDGVRGRATNGELGYVSPCPPSGIHRYIFTLYALDKKLGLAEGSTKQEVLSALKGHVVGVAKLTGRYGRDK